MEQIIEFKLSEHGPSGRPTTSYFHDQTKISKEYLLMNHFIIYCYNIAGGNVTYFPLPGPNHLQNLIPKCKILNVIWIVSKRWIEQFNIFNWLSNVKNLVVSSGSEHVRNAIQLHLK